MARVLGVALVLLAGCDNGISSRPRVDAVPTGSDSGTPYDTGPEAAYSCDAIEVDGTCREFTGAGWDLAAATAACDAGTVVTGNCPYPDRLGSCELAAGSVNEETVIYYDGTFHNDAEVPYLTQACLGTWEDAGGGSTTLGR